MDLRAANIIDHEIEGHYLFFSFADQISTQPHHHDFYEIFLILKGSIIHHINGEAILLSEGRLVLIRPDDVHYYEPNGDKNCELINLAFLRRTFAALTDYLGLVGKENLLVLPALPPMVTLTTTEKNQLGGQLKNWGRLMYQDPARSRLLLRALLAQVVSGYFITRAEDFPNDTPWWLVEVCQRMQQKEHVIEGRDALIRIAKRTPEHVGRAFRAYLGITPSHFINNLRLDYAADLLLNTDHSVTNVCFEVGFDNLSYFYRVFKARWHCTPTQFRKTNRRSSIP